MGQDSPKRIPIALALGLAVLFLSTIITGTIGVMTTGSGVADWLVPFCNHTAMAVIAIAFILIVRGGNLRRYGFVRGESYNVGYLLLWGVGAGVVAAVIDLVTPFPPIQLPFEGSLIKTILLVWIWASICEEILTRGLIQGYLEPLRNRGFSIGTVRISLPVLVAAAFFGAMHVALLTLGVHPVRVLVIVVFGFALGLIAGYFRERSGSLIPAIVVHSIFNITGWLGSLLAG